ncbi:MAG: hypothetical protein U0175_31575 [Caldilineaceae bacterium]
MKSIPFFACVLGSLACTLLFTYALVMAQGPLYELSQSLLGSGDVTSGGAYTMTFSVGDPQADEASGGAYSLGGGILGGGARVAPTESTGPAAKLFLPLVER